MYYGDTIFDHPSQISGATGGVDFCDYGEDLNDFLDHYLPESRNVRNRKDEMPTEQSAICPCQNMNAEDEDMEGNVVDEISNSDFEDNIVDVVDDAEEQDDRELKRETYKAKHSENAEIAREIGVTTAIPPQRKDQSSAPISKKKILATRGDDHFRNIEVLAKHYQSLLQ